MEEFFQSTTNIIIVSVAFNFFLVLILFIINAANASKIKKLKAKYNKFMSGISDRNLEELINSCIENSNEVIGKNREIEKHINDIERTLMQCLQKIGIIRYNAFENMGSDLCFAIALLDSNDNGVVINGIYSRESSSTYAKPIIGGKSKYPLSAEEIQAVEIAKKSYRERVYTEN